MKKIILSLFSLICLAVSSLSISAPAYVAFIDAGSTSSRIHLYEYDDEYDAASSIPEIKNLLSKSVKPGLSSFANQPEAAGESLKPLFDEVLQKLNERSVNPKAVSLHILASAGMRLLPENKQTQIYAHLKKYLKDHYPYQQGDFRTITGSDEGLYGWLSVNYLKGAFQNNQPTVGSIDMGGASTQIAFATSLTPAPGKFFLVINRRPYAVFSQSFLNLGQDKAREVMLTSPRASSCYPGGYPIQQNQAGSFDDGACRKIYAEILEKHQVKQKVTPPKNQTFIAYSAVYHAYNFFKPNQKQSLEQKIKTVCAQTWVDLQKAYPNDPYLSNYCANGVYIDQLLHHAYELKKDWVVAADKINGKSIEWVQGALLYQLAGKDVFWEKTVSVKQVTAMSALVSWSPAFGAKPIYYDVILRGGRSRVKVHRNVSGHSLRLHGLKPNSIYAVAVVAKIGSKQLRSTPVNFKTKTFSK